MRWRVNSRIEAASGVQLTHHNFYAFNEHAARNARDYPADMDWNAWDDTDVSMVAMPVFHISGTGWGVVGIYSGAFAVVLREFENAAVIETIRDFKVSKTVDFVDALPRNATGKVLKRELRDRIATPAPA